MSDFTKIAPSNPFDLEAHLEVDHGVAPAAVRYADATDLRTVHTEMHGFFAEGHRHEEAP